MEKTLPHPSHKGRGTFAAALLANINDLAAAVTTASPPCGEGQGGGREKNPACD